MRPATEFHRAQLDDSSAEILPCAACQALASGFRFRAIQPCDFRRAGGTAIHRDFVPAEDATAVARLREAGAVIHRDTEPARNAWQKMKVRFLSVLPLEREL